MTVIRKFFSYPYHKPDTWSKVAINRVIGVQSSGFFATVISNVLTRPVDGVPVQATAQADLDSVRLNMPEPVLYETLPQTRPY